MAPTIDDSPFYHVTEKDNGKTIHMRVGDRIEIDLPVHTSTPGYQICTRYDHMIRIYVWTETKRDHIIYRAIENGRVTLYANWKITMEEIDPDRRWEVYVVIGPFAPIP